MDYNASGLLEYPSGEILTLPCVSAITIVVMDGTMGHFFKLEKNLEFFRLKKCPIDAYPGKLE